MKIHHQSDHAERRRAEYPAIGDQLDALWKALAAMPHGTLPPEADAMLERIRAIKDEYPKPAHGGL